MANPNIVNVTNIFGKTSSQQVSTSPNSIVSNPSSSGTVIKVNSLVIGNVNGSNAATVNVDFFRGGTSYRIAYTVEVPADTTLVVLSKETALYLEEGDSLRVESSNSGYLEAVCSYEEIS